MENKKQMTHQEEILSAVKDAFKHNPLMEVAFATSDLTVFGDKNHAVNHAREQNLKWYQIKRENVETLNSAITVSKGTENPEKEISENDGGSEETGETGSESTDETVTENGEPKEEIIPANDPEPKAGKATKKKPGDTANRGQKKKSK
jgi:hypothetical protein